MNAETPTNPLPFIKIQAQVQNVCKTSKFYDTPHRTGKIHHHSHSAAATQTLSDLTITKTLQNQLLENAMNSNATPGVKICPNRVQKERADLERKEGGGIQGIPGRISGDGWCHTRAAESAPGSSIVWCGGCSPKP